MGSCMKGRPCLGDYLRCWRWALPKSVGDRLAVGSTPTETERGGAAVRVGWESAALALCELGMAVFAVSGCGVWRERRPSILEST